MNPVWPGPAPRQAGASGLPEERRTARAIAMADGGARPTRLSLNGWPAPLTRPFYGWWLAAPGLSLHTKTICQNTGVVLVSIRCPETDCSV
jgi:hypothetical protein